MKTLALVAALGAVLVAPALTAYGKRARPPETEICNRTKAKQYVATMSYSGRGYLRTNGWTFIDPGACRSFRSDRYAFKGGARVTGLAKKDALRGCVQNTKLFDITEQGGEIGDEKKCKERGGYIVEFKAPRPDNRQRTKQVVLRPRARAH